MSKKNVLIFISVLIVSLFFTTVFYFGYIRIKSNHGYYMATEFGHARIDDQLSDEDLEKLKGIKDISLIGKFSLEEENAKYNDDMIALNYEDGNLNKIREYSLITEGRFAENENELVLSENFVKKNNLKIGDNIELRIGKRLLDGKVIDPVSPNTDREQFRLLETKTFKMVGIYSDVYNKYSRLSFALGFEEKMKSFRTYIKFISFKDAYRNKENVQKEVNESLGREVKLIFNEPLIHYYGLDSTTSQKIIKNSVPIFTIIFCMLIFVFFIKNIFLVWSLRKIRELSVYKSIGSTDFQIYKVLLKEGFANSVIPILVGHFTGFYFVYYLIKIIGNSHSLSKFEQVEFNPVLSLAIISVSLLVVAIAISSPGLKISKINIIDGIRGNIDFYDSKKRRSPNLWKELKFNNLAAIKSQRFISAIGVIIISVFIITNGIAMYYMDLYEFDDGFNFRVNYYSKKHRIPEILHEIERNVACEKAYIYKEKYVQIIGELDFSKEAIRANLNEEAEKIHERAKNDYSDAVIIALEERDLKKLGGKKGDYIFYNSVQKNFLSPISKGKMIPYLENPSSFNIRMGNGYETSIKISESINDVGVYKYRVFPFQIVIYTDFETYFKLMEESGDTKAGNYPFNLNMKIDKSKTEDVREYVVDMIRSDISPDERFNVSTGVDDEKNRESDIKNFTKIAAAIGSLILILNITNGYSSINLSLMSRKKEIGSLYSCGMDLCELKKIYEREFIAEQIKSFIISIFVSLAVMFIISVLSWRLSLYNLLLYYDYKIFMIFSCFVYGVNILIYHISLKKIFKEPVIKLIRVM